MALLYRFTQLEDRGNTGVFTFIATRSVTRDIHRDATTKDFTFAYQRWAISFCRTERLLGVYLISRSVSPGFRCFADFTFSLLNREHFSRNEIHTEKQRRFSVEQPAHGIAKWLLMADLHGRKFADENGEFLLELAISNLTTVFECDVRTGHFPFSTHNNLESQFFVFGGFEWNIAISEGGNARPKAALNRLTGFEHPCHVQYRLVLGEGEKRVDTGIIDQVSDVSGFVRGYALNCAISDLSRRGLLHVFAELISANTLSEVLVATERDPTAAPNCYDKDKQSWCVESDLENDLMRVKLFCTDLHHVPRNHVRYVSWNAFVIRRNITTGVRESIAVLHGPHWNYYVQDGVDMGVVMDTNIPTKEIKEISNPYLEENGQLTIHVEWLECLLLFSSSYHKYDDLYRVHCQQMRREVAALQAENYGLERQLFSYQKSISLANSRGLSEDQEVPNHENSPTENYT